MFLQVLINIFTSHRLGTSDSLLHQIQEKIKWADTMSEVNKKHQKEFEDRVEEAKKSIKVSLIKLKFFVFNFSC